MSINIDIRQMRVVLAVLDRGGYTAASEALHVSQSAISRTVQEVELALGTAVFTRTTRSVAPTPDGAHFLNIARNIVTQFDRGLNHFSGYLDGKQGTVMLATVSSVASTLLPEILSNFCQLRPDVSVSIQDGFSEETLERVLHGTVDLALTAVHSEIAGLVMEPIAADRFLCIYRPDHRFARMPRIAWPDLQDEPVIAFDRRSSIHLQIDVLLGRLGIAPRTVLQAREVNAIAGLVSAGMGIAIIPALLLPTVQFVSLEHQVIQDPVLERKICIVYDELRPLAQPARALMQALRSAPRQDITLPTQVSWCDAGGPEAPAFSRTRPISP